MKNKVLNILYHHRTQGRGAEGVHIKSIVNALESMGHCVTVLSPPGVDPLSHAGNAPVDKSNVNTKGINSLWKFISKNLPNWLFEIAEIVYNIPAMRRLEKELSSKKYDLIYERYAFYLIAGAIKSKKYKIPLVLEANEVSGINNRARKQSFPFLCGVFERFLFKRCSSIHTVSSFLKNMILQQGVSTNNVDVTPNAIDPLKFNGVKNCGDLKKQYAIDNSIILGFAGWFDDWDRLDLLVDVFSRIKEKHTSVKLLLVGDGEVLANVRKKAKSYHLEEDVILTGPVPRDKIQQYLSLLDIAVITHSNEFGSPVVMFEFMGLKIPIIAPKLLPITDVLIDNETALLFDVLNMEQLEGCIEKAIIDKNLCEYISSNSYYKLMNEHTWKQNAEHIIKSSGVLN